MTESARAGGLGFPADQTMVPVVVGAAFALPALVALAWSTLARIGARIGPLVGVAVLALMALAAIGLLQPDLLSRLGV